MNDYQSYEHFLIVTPIIIAIWVGMIAVVVASIRMFFDKGLWK